MEKCGYVKRIFSDESKRERLEVKTLIHFGVNQGSSVDVSMIHPQVNRESNRERVIESNTKVGVEGDSLNQKVYSLKDYINLYRDLYINKYGSEYKIMSWPKHFALVKKLTTTYTPEQCRAILFCHFEWRGYNQDDN